MTAKRVRMRGLVLCLCILAVGLLAAGGYLWRRHYDNVDVSFDQTTYATARTIASQLNSSISGDNYIPDDLPTGSTLPNHSSVLYARLTYTTYKFCVTYRTGNAAQSSTPNTTSLEIPAGHIRGWNCQIIHPYVDPIQQTGSLYVCDNLVNKIYGDGYQSSGYIDALFTNVNNDLVIQLKKTDGRESGPFAIFPGDLIFDSQCRAIPASQIRIGQPMYVFNSDDGHQVFLQEALSWH